MSTIPSFTLPIVARGGELALFDELRAAAVAGTGPAGGVVLLSGDGGVGKTRLVTEAATAARAAQWRTVVGRGYAVETAIPYAPFADALEPLLTALDSGVLTRLTRGDRGVLAALAPSLVAPGANDDRGAGLSVAEQRVRLHSSIVQLLGKLAAREPLMLVLENLQWADASSLELFHFVARQAPGLRLLLVGTWNETEREPSAALSNCVRSLRSIGTCRELRLGPLSLPDVRQLLVLTFGVDDAAVTPFAVRLFDATRGNPFFIDQTLRELINRGELHRVGSSWLGWQLERFVLPESVRDLLQARLDRLSAHARRLAEWIAVIGTEAEYDLLLAVSELADQELLGALDELKAAGMLAERVDGSAVLHDLSHPLLRQALGDMIGLARERKMHANIANALELIAGANAEQSAEKLAAHWRRADPHVEPARAIRWLTAAAAQAMTRLARREASLLLRGALERADEMPDACDDAERARIVDELSRLYRRLGEYSKAIGMATRARDDAARRGDAIGVATAERRLGLSSEGLSRRREAIMHFDAGIAALDDTRDDVLLARLRLAKGICLQALGQPEDAKREVALALQLAERLDRVSLLARAHRTLLMLHLWSGPAHRAWAHARAAVSLAEDSGERNLAWTAHWSAAVLAGMTSNATALQRHLAEASRLADELSSPLLQLRTTEIAVEYRAGLGEWNRALVDGERAIQSARALEQSTMLARLLFWVGSMHLQRGETSVARAMFDEAWEVSGAGSLDTSQPFEVHGVLPAHVARVTWLAAVGEHARAIELGRAAVHLADRSGNIAWAVHRLLPTMAASALTVGDEGVLAEVRHRLATDATWLGHPIGQAWVDIIDAEVAMRSGESPRAIALLQQSVAALESVPYAFDAASARLRLARVLQRAGSASEAVREAQASLQLFESLAAAPAIEEARTLLRSLGAALSAAARPGESFASLTARELDIVRLVAQRLSNKEIGARLGISDRTVGTHLANVFGKCGIRDRTLLGDAAREEGLHRPGAPASL